MDMRLRPIVPVLALVLSIPSARAAVGAGDHTHGWLGVLLDDAAPMTSVNATDPVEEHEGALVRGVVDGSPADESRLRAKDEIIAIDGTAVSGASDVMARLRELEPGSLVTLSVKRAGHDLELSTTLAKRPENGRVHMIRGWLGLEAIELPASLRTHFGAPEDSGILVSNVVEGSPAEDSGIRVGDVIYEADGKRVTSVESLSGLVSEAGVENTIDVVLARDGARIVVGPQIARAPSGDR
jgi:serine protease Do